MNLNGKERMILMTTTIDSVPQAALLLHSLRSVGYSEEAAIADIVDNAISAGADKIYVNFSWQNEIVSIVDNGQGMKPDELYRNMQIGSADPESSRSSNDLGRFGMGMKTAAFSLGRKLTVISKKNGIICNASWDLDKVKELGWKLIVEDNSKYFSWLDNYENCGTAVVISKLDNLVDPIDLAKSKKNFYLTVNRVAEHLRLIFHRFISEDSLKIYVNQDMPLEAWDPFITSNQATQELADEEIWDSEYKIRTYIQPYVLPHKTKFVTEKDYENAGGFRGWNRHQGIYLYRNRRLIIYGTWFNLIKKEPAFNLARIKIDITSDADKEWKIDIKKSRASLPVYLKEKILRSVDNCTTRSMRVFNSRGSYSKYSPYAPNLDYVWEQTRNNGFYSFKINKNHILLNEIRKQLDDEGKEQLRAYLSLVENFAPFMHSGVLDTVNTGVDVHNEVQKQKDLADIEKYARVFKKQGFSKAEILETILNMSIYSYLENDIKKLVEALND